MTKPVRRIIAEEFVLDTPDLDPTILISGPLQPFVPYIVPRLVPPTIEPHIVLYFVPIKANLFFFLIRFSNKYILFWLDQPLTVHLTGYAV